MAVEHGTRTLDDIDALKKERVDLDVRIAAGIAHQAQAVEEHVVHVAGMKTPQRDHVLPLRRPSQTGEGAGRVTQGVVNAARALIRDLLPGDHVDRLRRLDKRRIGSRGAAAGIDEVAFGWRIGPEVPAGHADCPEYCRCADSGWFAPTRGRCDFRLGRHGFQLPIRGRRFTGLSRIRRRLTPIIAATPKIHGARRPIRAYPLMIPIPCMDAHQSDSAATVSLFLLNDNANDYYLYTKDSQLQRPTRFICRTG
ncbi:MAG TPA: hypothetical protein VFJ08_03750 [Salinisphaera sp.]|nr:hypothetical protein [Salinisphaera sp.]HET7313451.1 hypothetical protein [Salinisphaera sp.]